jgi:lipoprotein-releasing system ATP-binding protein
MADPAALVVDKLVKQYPGSAGLTTVLDGVSLVAQPAETVAIVGPSGSGKSTLLNLLGSLDQPTSGTVRLGEVEVTALRGRDLAAFRATRVGFVFQDHHLLPQLTARENVVLPTLAPGADRQESADRARRLLDQVGLQERQEAFPAQLSGGERQRVAIARALINGPGLLLCDEPTGNLDRERGAQVVSLLLDLAAAQGVTVLMVTHNLEHASRFGRVLQLQEGQLVPLAADDTQMAGWKPAPRGTLPSVGESP